MVYLDLKIYVRDNKNDEPILGRGPIELLEYIKETGSIRKAAINMNMSYVKAHGIIKRMENYLKTEVVKKRIGGIYGGGSELTAIGVKLIESYNKLDSIIKKESDIVFKKIFNDEQHL